jgi:GNAT superfamily N-acetyltransferase
LKRLKDKLVKPLHIYRNFIKWHTFFPGNYYYFRFVCYKILSVLLHYDVLYIFKKNITCQDEFHESMQDISFGEASPEDYTIIMELNPNEPENFIRERLGNREICYVARSAEHGLCAYRWIAPGKRIFLHRGKKIFIDENEVYVRDTMTLPEYRGRGIHANFSKWVTNDLACKGKKVTSASIRGWNYSAQRAVIKAGYCLDEKVYFVSFPWIKRDFIVSSKRIDRG